MLAMNNQLFLHINAASDASPSIIYAAELIASELIYFIPLLLVAIWIWGSPPRRAGLAACAICRCARARR